MVPEAKRNEAAVAAARAALEVAEQAKSLGPFAELEEKVLANPLDHQARFDLAIALNAKGKREEAAQQLLEIVKRDRKWNDDGARKQLVQFFEAWGFDRSGGGRRPQEAVVDFVCVTMSSRTRVNGTGRATGISAMPMNAHYRGPIDLPETIPVFPLAGRVAVAARADAAQHLRAALSGDDRRCAARRPSPDRHDPARPDAGEHCRQAEAVQGRLRRPHHPARRERRRPLSASSSPALRASRSSRS